MLEKFVSDNMEKTISSTKSKKLQPPKTTNQDLKQEENRLLLKYQQFLNDETSIELNIPPKDLAVIKKALRRKAMEREKSHRYRAKQSTREKSKKPTSEEARAANRKKQANKKQRENVLLLKYNELIVGNDEERMEQEIPYVDLAKIRKILKQRKTKLERQNEKRARERQLLEKYAPFIDEMHPDTMKGRIPVEDLEIVERALKYRTQHREILRRRKLADREKREKIEKDDVLVEVAPEEVNEMPCEMQMEEEENPTIQSLLDEFRQSVEVDECNELVMKENLYDFRNKLIRLIEIRQNVAPIFEFEDPPPLPSVERPHSNPFGDKFICDLCSSTFKSRHGLKLHLQKEFNLQKIFVCPISGCQKRFTRVLHYRDHMLSHQGGGYTCGKCKRVLHSKLTLKDHLFRLHFPAFLLACSVPGCKRTFTQRYLLRNHETRHAARPVRQKRVYRSERVICDLCGRSMVKSLLNQHLNEHFGLTPYVCPVAACSMAFSSARKLRHHRRDVHESNGFICPVCSTHVAKDRKALQEHLKEQHDVEARILGLFVCHCGSSFDRRENLKIHERTIHVAGRPMVPCPHCDAQFRDAGKLKQHVVKHTGTREFSCEICKKSYAHNSTLYNHLLKVHKVKRIKGE